MLVTPHAAVLCRYLLPQKKGGSCCTAQLLKEAGVSSARSVVVAGSGALSAAEADAFVTVAMLQVEARGGGLHGALAVIIH